MKYIKEYKDIDWDDWDDEEEDPDMDIEHPEFIGYDKFLKFLKRHGVLNEYIKKFHQFGERYDNDDSIIDFLHDAEIRNYIYNAFPAPPSYNETSSRYGKWETLHSLWLKEK